MARINAFPIMTAINVVPHDPPSGRSKRLKRESFPLLHPCLISPFDDGDTLPAVDLVRVDVVSREIPDGLDWVDFPVYFDFVGFHGLLDGGANVTE